jgi:hypothetical protein
MFQYAAFPAARPNSSLNAPRVLIPIWEIRVNSILKLDRAAKASREEQEQDDAPQEEAAA